MADAIEALSEGFALFDEDRRLLLCNGRFLRMNPILADLIAPGVGWDLLLREAKMRGLIDEETARRLRWLESRLEPGAAPESVEVEAPNGTAGAVTLSATRSGGFVVTQRDVTARRQLAANDQEGAQILNKVLEACPANVVMSRVGDGQVLYRTPAATELLGAAMTLSDHFASREERADFITALLPTGRVKDMDVTCLHADGSAFPASISARLIEYRGEDVVVSAIADLTRETAMQAELAAQRETIFLPEREDVGAGRTARRRGARA